MKHESDHRDPRPVWTRKCGKPAMREHRGETWVSVDMTIDGIVTDVYYDTSWGLWGYFCLSDSEWRKFRLRDADMYYEEEGDDL
jgi:hypothetical protein